MHYPLRLLLGAPPWITDPDARDFIQRVEAADGAALEDGIKLAYADFIRGCKADGNWNAIMAACILAAARTLSGALVPLKGAAPTNFNFVSGDYNRKTGLVGNGSTKYLNSNHKISQYTTGENLHLGLYGTAGLASGRPMGVFRATVYTRHYLPIDISSNVVGWGNSTPAAAVVASGHYIATRVTGQQAFRYLNGSVDTGPLTIDGSTPSDWPVGIFVAIGSATGLANEAQLLNGLTTARIALYHIGDGLTATQVANLSTRVTTLINAIGVAIP